MIFSQRSIKLSYACLTLVLACAVLYIFFAPILKNPNEVFFAKDYDGLQNYYNHIFHIKYDSSYLHTTGMNYPYGEMIFYTGAQLVPSAIIKFISNNIYDISDYIIAFQNIGMLISIVLAAVFLFLVFVELGIGGSISCFSSVVIAFLSPQIDRFGGHFSLAISFFIPLVIYLLLLFNRKRKFYLSIILSFVLFWAYSTHPYLFVINSFIVIFYWGSEFLRNKNDWMVHSLHFLIQLVLPYLVVQLLTFIADPIIDRTASPWGLLFYRAYPEGVFLPFGRPYGFFLKWVFPKTEYLQWEGIAYVGLMGVFSFSFVIKKWFVSLKRKNYGALFSPIEHNTLNAIFWGAFAALLYSFGIPFILGLEGLTNYIGPLKQLRGIGRFTWAFFYVINIVGVYFCWLLYQKKRNVLFVLIPIMVLSYDAYLNVRGRVQNLTNSFPAITDRANALPENSWMHKINPSQYQAIIPLPYYHLGSENVWISSTCNSMANSLLISLKTGIPTTGIYMSRTSISQSFNNIQVVQEPYREIQILKSCTSQKPFLLLISKCNNASDSIYLLKHSKCIFSGDNFSLYSLPFQALQNYSDTLFEKNKAEFMSKKLHQRGDLYYSDSTVNFVYQSFDSLKNNEISYLGSAAFSGDATQYQTIFYGSIPAYNPSKKYILSFWVGNIFKDTYLRSSLIISKFNSAEKGYKEDYYNIGSVVKIFDNDWALCELPVELDNPGDQIKITLRSEELRKCNFVVDELIIRPVDNEIYKLNEKGIVKNNRLYLRSEK